MSYAVPYTSKSSLTDGLHVSASLGGGPPHAFLVDTGSVGMLVPRAILGPDFQTFDPSQDVELQYVSSGKTYSGQWVSVPVVLGVPADWDGTGTHPTAQVEVFAVDQPADFTGGMLGIGFAIGGHADGGPARNPLLHLTYNGTPMPAAYIVQSGGIIVGIDDADTAGFAFAPLARNAAGTDWNQRMGTLVLSGGGADGFIATRTLLMDTGIPEMILWTTADDAPAGIASGTPFPNGITVSVTVPGPLRPPLVYDPVVPPIHPPEPPPIHDPLLPPVHVLNPTPGVDPSGVIPHPPLPFPFPRPFPIPEPPLLHYTFITGDASATNAPSFVEWRVGNGINTGRSVLAVADYCFDAAAGRIGYRAVAKADSGPPGAYQPRSSTNA